MFKLAGQLASDCIVLGDFQLCTLLLMNDAQYPWFILVPRREDATEIFQLSVADRSLLMEESCLLAEKLKDAFAADKMNIAALGNVVSQLHVHHVVRYRKDHAWPAPVWGKSPAVSYTPELLNERIGKLRAVLTNGFTFAESCP
ncbi:HIT family protein [Halopseudomonas pelagia]|uniref:HIT family protein n=1 Tax=Halopseudomonas pelagia TaxID=553151 RepID=UPI00039B2313|nr:HIT domain-containing protein [Halopseudomonas pelagia]|tara:strand:+ start:840 stop:1271 length:432 start_codon:yes stop_codon:yes gene_type:complete